MWKFSMERSFMLSQKFTHPCKSNLSILGDLSNFWIDRICGESNLHVYIVLPLLPPFSRFLRETRTFCILYAFQSLFLFLGAYCPQVTVTYHELVQNIIFRIYCITIAHPFACRVWRWSRPLCPEANKICWNWSLAGNYH